MKPAPLDLNSKGRQDVRHHKKNDQALFPRIADAQGIVATCGKARMPVLI